MQIKIMTFNVQHFREFYSGNVEYEPFAEAIRESGADIVGINESYGANSSFGKRAQAEELAEALGWNWYFAEATHLGDGSYGNSIVSKYPLKNERTVVIPDPRRRRFDGYYETRCVLLCTALIDGVELDIAVTHFGLNPDEHKKAVRKVKHLIRPRRFVLMGDLNVEPDDGILAPIGKRLADTAALLGEDRLTFPSDSPKKKIDYLFVSPDIKVLSAEIPPLVVSDHRPYLAELEIY